MNQRNQIDSNIDSNIHLPESWGGWRLTGVLGKGAYGTVYRAEDESGHVAAIKIIRLPEGAEVPETDLLPLLKDIPGVVRVEDYCIQEAQGRSEGVLRMEYLTDLVSWKRNHDLTEEEAIDWMIQLCHTLAVCEKEGIIHRDIKPGNILIDEEGQAKLGDFGVARVVDPAGSRMSLAGTFRYMAPEVYHGEAYDHRADIYSLGMVFYELMNAGKIPFEEQGREQALKQRMSGKHFLRPVRASKGFADILLKACAYEPDARYPDAEELERDLNSLKRGDLQENNRKKGPVAVTVLLAVIGLAIAAGLWVSRPIVPRESCGKGVSWILKRNGTLEISGKGRMNVFQQESVTKEHRKMLSHFDRIKKLVVKGEVRYIDFSGVTLPNLEEAVFSEGVKQISPNSFADQTKLETAIFQGRDVELGLYVFSGCSKLSEVVLPSELTRIPEGCFLDCAGLNELTIPDTVSEIGRFAFDNTSWYMERYQSMDSLIVGDQVLVFWKGPEEELSITGETGVSHIGGNAFYGSSLKRIHMDDSVLSIGNGAFLGTPLESVTLPDHLSVIPDYAFSGCRSLKNIVLPDSLTRIGDQAFWGCSSLKKMSLPSTLESMGWNAFDETPYKKMHTDQAGFTVIGDFLIDYKGNETDLVIPDNLGITRTCDYCMEQNQRIRSLTFPEGLKVIGDYSFFMCPKLETISFPKSLEKIGQGAFEETPWGRK